MKKYIGKLRIILVLTPSKTNDNYKHTNIIYERDKKIFHRNYVKKLTKISNRFLIKVIGLHGKVLKNYTEIHTGNIIKLFKTKSSVERLKKYKDTLINLSLYEDYNKKTTLKGLGFKNKEIAESSIKLIMKRPLKYQKAALNTMIGRAKNHPYQTAGMRDAIKILSKRYKQL